METYEIVFGIIVYLFIISIITTILYFALGKPELIECVLASGIIFIGILSYLKEADL